MPRVTFIHTDGEEISCDAENGRTLMETAVLNRVRGIIAECGGAAACGTCHVVLDDKLFADLGPISKHEDEMLDYTSAERQPGSRLSCQIEISALLEGARIRISEN